MDERNAPNDFITVTNWRLEDVKIPIHFAVVTPRETNGAPSYVVYLGDGTSMTISRQTKQELDAQCMLYHQWENGFI